MNTCWQCGAATGDNTNECPKHKFTGEAQSIGPIPDGVELAELDWGRVNSFADLRYVLSILFPHMVTPKDSPIAKALRNFLRE